MKTLRPVSRSISVQGHIARYLELGRGRPIVLLASPLIAARSYRPVIRALSKHGRVIAVDLPGAGFSQKVRAPWTPARYADWLERFFERLGLEDVTLIGHSNSGAVALLAASFAPERLRELVLVDTIGFDPSGSHLRVLLARLLTAAREPRFTLSSVLDIAVNLARHPRNFVHQARLPARLDLRAAASRVRVPTVIAWGARDRTMRTPSIWEARRRMPHARVALDPRGDHDWLVQHAPAFAEAFGRALRSGDVAPSPLA